MQKKGHVNVNNVSGDGAEGYAPRVRWRIAERTF